MKLTVVAALSIAAVGAQPLARHPVTETTTFHVDALRTGWYPNETVLTPATVSGGGFGPLWSSPQFDYVTLGNTTYAPHLYASPLYLDDVALTTGPFNGRRFHVVF